MSDQKLESIPRFWEILTLGRRLSSSPADRNHDCEEQEKRRPRQPSVSEGRLRESCLRNHRHVNKAPHTHTGYVRQEAGVGGRPAAGLGAEEARSGSKESAASSASSCQAFLSSSPAHTRSLCCTQTHVRKCMMSALIVSDRFSAGLCLLSSSNLTPSHETSIHYATDPRKPESSLVPASQHAVAYAGCCSSTRRERVCKSESESEKLTK